MGEVRHTPGPWDFRPIYKGQGFEVSSEDYSICGVFADLEPEELPAAANARLIAASPDLLEALDWLLASIEADPKGERYPGDGEERLLLARASARAAIAKATGSDQ